MLSKKGRWLGFLLLLFIGIPGVQAAVRLSVDTPAPTAGYFQLSWGEKLPAGSILQQSAQADFAGVREWRVAGADSFSMSGLGNGEYFYRLQTAQGISNAVSVKVQHHSLGKAWLFFGVGAALFLYLIFYIFSSLRRKPAVLN